MKYVYVSRENFYFIYLIPLLVSIGFHVKIYLCRETLSGNVITDTGIYMAASAKRKKKIVSNWQRGRGIAGKHGNK